MSKDTLYPIELTKAQKDWLKEQAAKEDRSMAWVIRRLIDKAMGENRATLKAVTGREEL